MSSFVQSRRFTIFLPSLFPPQFRRPPHAHDQAIRPPQADLGGTVSMRQNDLAPLDLIARETRCGLAMWTDDRRLARDCYAEVWTVTRIDGFLECDKSLAL
jgi:hypothetical protein